MDHRKLLWAVWGALLVLLAACGAPDTSAPEKTALAFFKAYQAGDNADLTLLSNENLRSMGQMLCNGSLVDCVNLAVERPRGFDFKDQPTARVLQLDGTTATVETRHMLSDGAATRLMCISYDLEQLDQQWLVDDIHTYSVCRDDATATAAVEQANRDLQQTASAATSEAFFTGLDATAEAESANATATEQARPTAAAAGDTVDEAGILAYFTKQGATSTAGIVIDKVDGEYARVFVGMGTDAAAIVYLKYENPEWVLVASGVFFTAEDLERLGIPRSLLLE